MLLIIFLIFQALLCLQHPTTLPPRVAISAALPALLHVFFLLHQLLLQIIIGIILGLDVFSQYCLHLLLAFRMDIRML